jgi:hypothetical protein
MVKTQIQMPDDLYARIKELAEKKEWSLAEAFRRGAELLLQRYPAPGSASWAPPKPRRLGWRDLTDAEVHAAAIADMEPRIVSSGRKR